MDDSPPSRDRRSRRSWVLAFGIIGGILIANTTLALVLDRQATVATVIPTNAWNGFVAHDHTTSFVEASGSWIVPSTTTCDASGILGIWVGLGGFSVTPASDRRIIDHAGVALRCDTAGESLVAFTEVYPEPPIAQHGFAVSSGDAINVLVEAHGSSARFTFDDNTSGSHLVVNLPSPITRFTTAECIVEATPKKGSDNFHHLVVSFRTCGARRPGGSLDEVGSDGKPCTAVVAVGLSGHGRINPERCTGRFDVTLTREPSTKVPAIAVVVEPPAYRPLERKLP
jgi:hypothetical protein